MTVKRNAYGAQIDSRFRELSLSGPAAKAGLGNQAYFIRAPAVMEVGAGVQVLATAGQDDKVAVLQGKKLATAFHPEISNDDSWHGYFLSSLCGMTFSSPPAAPPAVAAAAPWAPVPQTGSDVGVAVKRAFAVFQKGGVIMDVVNAEQARIAEAAGAVSVMALERIPADIKADGGVARSSDPAMIKDVISAISIPCMAKARIGHFYEVRDGSTAPPRARYCLCTSRLG